MPFPPATIPLTGKPQRCSLNRSSCRRQCSEKHRHRHSLPQLYGRALCCQDNQAWRRPAALPDFWRNGEGNQTRPKTFAASEQHGGAIKSRDPGQDGQQSREDKSASWNRRTPTHIKSS